METNLWQGLRALNRLLSLWTAVLGVRAVSNYQELWPASSNLKGAVCSLNCTTELARSLAKVINREKAVELETGAATSLPLSLLHKRPTKQPGRPQLQPVAGELTDTVAGTEVYMRLQLAWPLLQEPVR